MSPGTASQNGLSSSLSSTVTPSVTLARNADNVAALCLPGFSTVNETSFDSPGSSSISGTLMIKSSIISNSETFDESVVVVVCGLSAVVTGAVVVVSFGPSLSPILISIPLNVRFLFALVILPAGDSIIEDLFSGKFSSLIISTKSIVYVPAGVPLANVASKTNIGYASDVSPLHS